MILFMSLPVQSVTRSIMTRSFFFPELLSTFQTSDASSLMDLLCENCRNIINWHCSGAIL